MSDDVAIRVVHPDGTELGTVSVSAVIMPAAKKPDMRRYGANLALLAFVGIGFCAWLARFTDDLPIVAATLGLGGALVWIAFLANLVGDESKKELQRLFDTMVMNSRTTTIVLSIIAIAGLLFALTHGSLLVVSHDDTTARSVTVYDVDRDGFAKHAVDDVLLPANAEVKLPLCSWLGRKRYLVYVTGFPAVEADVNPLVLKVLRTPSAFSHRPVMLVHMTSLWTNDAAAGNRWQVCASLARGARRTAPDCNAAWDGRALWIGCDAAVPVPDGMRDKWKSQLMEGELAPDVWKLTGGLMPRVALRKGDVITLSLRNGQEEAVKTRPVFVNAGGYQSDAVQEVYLGK